jgi:hypothetical protein
VGAAAELGRLMVCVGLTHQMTALTLGNSACYRLRQLSTVQQPVQDRASSLEAPAGCGISNCVYLGTLGQQSTFDSVLYSNIVFV